jgi:intein-encoded DNA endonuclease-like protein
MSPLVASVSFMNSVVQHYKMLSWNVRGLNSQAKQEDVRQVIHLFSLDVICLQETKLERVDNALMRNVLGPAFDSNFSCLPAQGSVGDYHCC